MTIIAFACFLALFIYDQIHIRRVKKHDGVLFPFCQLRRDVMKFRYDAIMSSSTALSREESESLRRLSRVLDKVIHNYSQHKKIMFNLRAMMMHMRKHRAVLKEIKPLQLTDNSDIQEFYARFAYLSAKAFIAYTPLIRSEFVLRASAFFAQFIWRVGKMRAQYFIQCAATVREDERRFAATV